MKCNLTIFPFLLSLLLLATITPTSAQAATPNRKIYPGPQSDYAILKTPTGYTVREKIGFGYGSLETLADVDSLQFADGIKNLTISEKAATIPPSDLDSLVELYIAFFNRVPDASGLSYWIADLQGGRSIKEIAGSFYQAGVDYSQYTGYSQAMSNAEFINVIYKNVLGRPSGADAGGMAYWSQELANGNQTRGSLVAAILEAAHGYKGDALWGWVPDLLDNKITAGKYNAITAAVDYLSDAEAIGKGMAVAAAVTPTDYQAALALCTSAADSMPTANTTVYNTEKLFDLTTGATLVYALTGSDSLGGSWGGSLTSVVNGPVIFEGREVIQVQTIVALTRLGVDYGSQTSLSYYNPDRSLYKAVIAGGVTEIPTNLFVPLWWCAPAISARGKGPALATAINPAVPGRPLTTATATSKSRPLPAILHIPART